MQVLSVCQRCFSVLSYARVRGHAPSLVDGWENAGFIVEGRTITVTVGSMRFELVGDASERDKVDLLKFTNFPYTNMRQINDSILVGPDEGVRTRPAEHPNGITSLDHVVIKTTEIEKVEDCLSNELRLTLRRRASHKDGTTMLFYREKNRPGQPAAPIIEVVGQPPEKNPVGTALSSGTMFQSKGRLKTVAEEDRRHFTYVWGLAFVAEDLGRVRECIGHEHVSEPRSALQKGRRICTIKGVSMGTQIAVMTPHVKSI